jgi:hypothetical protein
MQLGKAGTKGTLQSTYDNLDNDSNNIEYIKMSYNDGSYEEHWRDKANTMERTDRYDENGNFVNRILVLDNGTKVINVGLENGKFEIYSWKMPEKIAKENNINLKGSILREVKDSLKTKTWTIEDKNRTKTSSVVQKLLSNNGNNIERYSSGDTDIYIEKNNNKIKCMEVYENDSLKRVEEYDTFKDTSKDLFKINNKINKPDKEINAPVSSEDSVG